MTGRPYLSKTLLLIYSTLTGFSLSGCALFPFSSAPNGAGSSPSSPPPQTGAIAPSPSIDPTANNPAAVGQPTRCETATHFADITWQNNQPRMTFSRKGANPILRDATPVKRTPNPDGSITYGFTGEETFYARIYLDNTCFLQILGSNNTLMFEESGVFQIPGRPPAAVQPTPQPTPPRAGFNEGYQRGYQVGFQTGQTHRRNNLGSNAEAAYPGSVGSSPEFNQGFRQGFIVGFNNGYQSVAENISPQEPNQDKLTMQCSGSIQDRVDFTAYFTRELGFSRIDLRPINPGDTLTTNLSYSGQNDQGQSIWRGSVADMADVTLVHLSSAPAQRGDQISVGYDNSWGRATCQ
ncbi:MAG TPA: hypothetical protein IGS37_19815 [Synechococcales cyanobacterium M55_K2018_004]|nr:hypothetical protein [Synechococcales cyanobacterium M55_K2018_004]